MKLPLLIVITALFTVATNPAAKAASLYSRTFLEDKLGNIPLGWTDLVDHRPQRNWGVDGNGFLRVMLKEYVGNPIDGDRKRRRGYLEGHGIQYFAGILSYRGALADGSSSQQLGPIEVAASFKKTADKDVFFGVVLGLKDRDSYLEARFLGANKLQVVQHLNKVEKILAEQESRVAYPNLATWKLEFKADKGKLSARLLDDQGTEQAAATADDSSLPAGSVGITATTFASCKSFEIRSLAPIVTKFTPEQIQTKNDSDFVEVYQYPIVKPVTNPNELNTSFANIKPEYDIIVAGAGTGGIGAALQAARMGTKVLLLEETDLIGGQMANAGVTSMDEGPGWGKFPVRERGIYREFNESGVNFYYTRDKDPYTAYHFNLQSKTGMEINVSRKLLYGLIEETRQRTLPGGGKPILDLAVRTKVASVHKENDAVTGVTLEEWTEDGPQKKDVSCRVLVEATEYGDVLPLTGARYRVATSTSDKIDPNSPVQDHTWTGIVKEYPQGVPAELKFKDAPPDYEWIKSRFRNYSREGAVNFETEKLEITGNKRVWSYYINWRGMPDLSSPETGTVTEIHHTRGGLNGGNDYPITAATIEDPVQRKKDELVGINRTLGIIYWLQNEIGVPWSVTTDDGYDTPYNRQRMRDIGVREDLIPIAAHLPQWPYVREARRMIGMSTIRGRDAYTRDREGEAGKYWADAVAINDYGFDLHGTEDQIEVDLDEPNYPSATGPFQIPFGAFIPEKVDGLVAAEKNISQSRIINGATRLQPSTMLNGQAAGAIAALATRDKIQPRQVNIIQVQAALLDAGDTLMSRWYSDVPYASPIWKATQLISLYGMLDRPEGILNKEGPVGQKPWGVSEAVSPEDRKNSLLQLAKVVPENQIPADLATKTITRGELALQMAGLMRQHGRYLITDPAPYAPPHDVSGVANAKGPKVTNKRPKKDEVDEEEPPARDEAKGKVKKSAKVKKAPKADAAEQ